MNLAGGQQVSYQQSTTQTNTSHHFGSESRQSSYSSLGPANPIPENYGAGNPPPFTPPAPVSYGADSGGMPSPVGSGINTENMTKEEFEEAKARGKIPTWMVSNISLLAHKYNSYIFPLEIRWWRPGWCCCYWLNCLGSS